MDWESMTDGATALAPGPSGLTICAVLSISSPGLPAPTVVLIVMVQLPDAGTEMFERVTTPAEWLGVGRAARVSSVQVVAALTNVRLTGVVASVSEKMVLSESTAPVLISVTV